MFCLRLPPWLQARTQLCTFPLQRVHKFASLQEARLRAPNKVQRLLYPFTDVDAYLDSSVDRTQFHLFQPCLDDVLKAERLFCSSPSHHIDYYMSAERMDHSPALKQPEYVLKVDSRVFTTPVSREGEEVGRDFKTTRDVHAVSAEKGAFIGAVLDGDSARRRGRTRMVCFIGRSNVGKSSLIKSLFSLSPNVEVKISKTPGHTKKMNFFRVGRAFTIVDMPGYGHRAPKDFVDMVEPYLYSRKNLVRTFLLVDGSVGLQKTDHIALEMCEETRCPYVMVVTKIDKCGRGSLLTNLLNFQDVIKTQTTSCFPQPFLVSSLQFSGIYLLRCFIAHITGNIQLTDTSQI